MLLQTAEVALIQMSHIQVLAPKGQHIQKSTNMNIWMYWKCHGKTWMLGYEIFFKTAFITIFYLITEHSMMVCDNMN